MPRVIGWVTISTKLINNRIIILRNYKLLFNMRKIKLLAAFFVLIGLLSCGQSQNDNESENIEDSIHSIEIISAADSMANELNALLENDTLLGADTSLEK